MQTNRERVFVCSPYAGDIAENERRAEIYCQFLTAMGFNPFAPHLFYTRYLEETNPSMRELGIQLGLDELSNRDSLAICGWEKPVISSGMAREIDQALLEGKGFRCFLVRFDQAGPAMYRVAHDKFFREAGYMNSQLVA